MSHTEAQLQFFIGNAAMIPCGSWLKSEMKGKIPDGFELGCFNLPSVPSPVGSPDAVFANTSYYHVMSRSHYPRDAVDFLRFMTSRDMAGAFSRTTDIVSAVKGASKGNLSPDMDELLDIIAKSPASYGVHSQLYPAMRQALVDAMTNLLSGVQPEQVARQLEVNARAAKTQADHPEKVIVNHRIKPALLLAALGLGAIYWIATTARDVRKRGVTKRVVGAASTGGLQRMRWNNLLLFVAPALLVYSSFVIVPSLRAFVWSVHEWNGVTGMSEMPFRGLLNFRRLLLESDAFWIALKNNLFLMVVVPAFVIPFSLFLATCISRALGGAKLFRVVFFFPNLIGGVAASTAVDAPVHAAGGPGEHGAGTPSGWRVLGRSRGSRPNTCTGRWCQRPTTDTHVISTRMVQTMFDEYKVGEATAIAVLLFFMVFLGSAATLRVMRRERVEM